MKTRYPKLVETRCDFLMKHCYLGVFSTGIKLGWDENMQTAGTNGVWIKFNESFYDKLLHSEKRGIFGHEIFHILLEHHLRRKPWMDCDETFNVSADVLVNNLCIENNLDVGKDAILPKNWPGGPDEFFKIAKMTLEQAYKYIAKKRKKKKGQSCEDGEQGNGSGKGAGVQFPDENGQYELPDYRSTGKVIQWKPEDVEGGSAGDGKETGNGAGKLTPAELNKAIEEESSRLKKVMAQALSSAKLQGALSAGMERLISEILSPRLKWTKLLMRDISAKGRSTYTWFPPNRRFIHQGLYLPKLAGQTIGNGIWATDSSGSMDEHTENEICAELNGLFGTHEGTCTCLSVDTEVNSVEKFSSMKLPIKPNWKGGGGTNYRPAFRWVRENMNERKVDWMIYATDGWCNRFPDVKPPYPVFWVVWDKVEFKPPFGKVIFVN